MDFPQTIFDPILDHPSTDGFKPLGIRAEVTQNPDANQPATIKDEWTEIIGMRLHLHHKPTVHLSLEGSVRLESALKAWKLLNLVAGDSQFMMFMDCGNLQYIGSTTLTSNVLKLQKWMISPWAPYAPL